MKEILIVINENPQYISTIISFATLIAAIYIPSKVMVNQIFADLISDYRSPEMGAAILALFHFYVRECKEDINVISDKYKDKYNEEIEKYLSTIDKDLHNTNNPKNGDKDFSNTLHFQRRMVAQFYFNMAVLRYKYSLFTRLSLRKMKMWFTSNDVKLLGIILHMAEPAGKMFIEAGDVPEPPEDDVPMNQLIGKLYEGVKDLQ